MRIVKVGVLAPTNKGIQLGVQGENRATDVEFDTRPWFREYPSGTVSAVAKRDGDTAPYPLALDVADGTAVWHVSDTDTAKPGMGAVELTMTSAGARVRSLTFKTLVTASLTDAPVDDDAWYGWLDRAVVKVDETVQSAQRKMAEVDTEWTELKADVAEKVEELGEVSAQAATDAHHAKVDAQATAKALESAEGSVAKAEAAATRAEGSAEQAYGAASNANVSAGNASAAASDAREALAQAAVWADKADNSARSAAASEANAATSASSAADSAERATAQKVAAENAKDAAESFKAGAEAAKGEAAASASNAASSATAAAKSASDAAASVNAINVIAPKNVSVGAYAPSYEYGFAAARGSKAYGGGIAVGVNAIAGNEEESVSYPVSIGAFAKVMHTRSVSIGAYSETSKPFEVSFGRSDTTREITHVSTPTADTSAATKKYTDDNDAKTLNEAKQYTDANTSNALVNTVSGKLLHVEDAWPSPLLSVTIDGACKQDGTPSPEAPVPIQVIENPVVKVTGRNFWDKGVVVYNYTIDYLKYNAEASVTLEPGTYTISSNGRLPNLQFFEPGSHKQLTCAEATDMDGANIRYSIVWNGYCVSPVSDKSRVLTITLTRAVEMTGCVVNNQGTWIQVENGTKATAYAPYTSASLPITLPAEHPYLAALPDGTHDEIVIDKDGNASLVARVGKALVVEQPLSFVTDTVPFVTFRLQLVGGKADALMSNTYKSANYSAESGYVYSPNSSDVVIRDSRFTSLDVAKELLADTVLYYKLSSHVTYPLGKLDIPSLPETISNVWTDAELTTNMSMTYKQDVNVVIADLTAQINALKGNASNDVSSASHAEAIDVLDNDVNVI